MRVVRVPVVSLFIMSEKTYISEGVEPESHIGATLEALAATIAQRQDAGEQSYTYRLLANDQLLLSKLTEEAAEVVDAAQRVANAEANAEVNAEANAEVNAEAKAEGSTNQQLDAELDHLRYEAGDVVYHLLVVLQRYGIDLDEFAAELNSRMTAEELPEGALLLKPQHINRGK